jgi:lysyl-tRNA synthetase class 2
MGREEQVIQERIKKLNELRKEKIEPYPYKFDKKNSSSELQKKYAKLAPDERTKDVVKTAGRVMTIRDIGSLIFSTIQDGEGKLQIVLQKGETSDKELEMFKKYVDSGDFVGVEGTVFRTKRGEISILVKSVELLSKSILPLPEKWHGIQDKEERYRKRYLDLIVSPDVKEVFVKRSLMIKAIREFLDARGFLEVETPLLQTQYGGASARPFVTHINAWNMKMYLSISPELYLKRLVVGGYEKVYTICKNFRNEGVDHSHNPEFSMIEIYEAYADYNDMMKLMEECYEYVCKKINGTTKVKVKDKEGKEVELDFKAPWKRMTLYDAVDEYTCLDIKNMTLNELKDYCQENKIPYTKDSSFGSLVQAIFDEQVEHKIIGPVHVYDRPKEATPLCKRHRLNKELNEQCEPIGLGMELGNIYSELNDPLMQEELLKEQAEKGRAGNEEAHPMDEDFLEAIRTGLPPTGGIGWGIDRMALLLLGQESIRDVIFFPTMKPEIVQQEKKEEPKKEEVKQEPAKKVEKKMEVKKEKGKKK